MSARQQVGVHLKTTRTVLRLSPEASNAVQRAAGCRGVTVSRLCVAAGMRSHCTLSQPVVLCCCGDRVGGYRVGAGCRRSTPPQLVGPDPALVGGRGGPLNSRKPMVVTSEDGPPPTSQVLVPAMAPS